MESENDRWATSGDSRAGTGLAEANVLDTERAAEALAAVATATMKAQGNQDAAQALVNRDAGVTAVIVADGLGSHHGADVAARVVVASVCESLAGLSSAGDLDVGALYGQAAAALTAHVEGLRDDLPPEVKLSAAFGTTLLCAIDTPDALVLAYVGNGAIVHVRSDFDALPVEQLWPWTAMNYLNPHSRAERGRNALYKFLAPWAPPAQTTPTVLTLSKDTDISGDVVIVCSDGIASSDQTAVGTDDGNQVWLRGEPTLTALFERFRAFLGAGPHSSQALEALLKDYLATLAERRLLSDDATVGVIVSPFTVHQRRARATGATGGPA